LALLRRADGLDDEPSYLPDKLNISSAKSSARSTPRRFDFVLLFHGQWAWAFMQRENGRREAASPYRNWRSGQDAHAPWRHGRDAHAPVEEAASSSIHYPQSMIHHPRSFSVKSSARSAPRRFDFVLPFHGQWAWAFMKERMGAARPHRPTG